MFSVWKSEEVVKHLWLFTTVVPGTRQFRLPSAEHQELA